ncbi:hypothetical protein [Dyadobacter bucti]|uniref:hypothetical protein n=1 Tax=Dyadobacter bucti TaxID=2572203 RepID=UPI003F727926
MKSLPLVTIISAFIFLSASCDRNRQEEQKSPSESQDLIEENSDLPRNTKYVFVILYVEQTEGYPPQVMTYTNLSGIEAVADLDEDRKYRIMDQCEAFYLNSVKAALHKGAVRDREIQVFDTYAQASRAREEIVKSHNN